MSHVDPSLPKSVKDQVVLDQWSGMWLPPLFQALGSSLCMESLLETNIANYWIKSSIMLVPGALAVLMDRFLSELLSSDDEKEKEQYLANYVV